MAEYKNVLEELAAHETLEDKIETIIDSLIKEVKEVSFVEGTNPSDAECFGLIMSKYMGWNCDKIVGATLEALEDSNFHSLNTAFEKTYRDWENHTDVSELDWNNTASPLHY